MSIHSKMIRIRAWAWILLTLLYLTTSDLHAQIIEKLDIPYVPGGGHKQQLDLFLPEGEGFPTLMLVHGGSLETGDRKDTDEPYGEIARTFAKQGIACAAISYRLFKTVDWPEPAEDVAAAFAWLHSNIGRYGGKTDRLFILGHSSGCTLSTLVAGDKRFLAKHGLSAKDITGVLAMGARLNWDATELFEGQDEAGIRQFFKEDRWAANFGSVEVLKSFRPMAHVGPHLPPMLVLIAEAERFKPPILHDAAAYVGAARDAGVDADIAILPDRKHYSSIRLLVSPEDPTFRLMVDFIRRLTPKE